jgi:hypothetical protein
MWFDKQSYLQTFARDFNQLILDNGWRNTLKYRITNGDTKFIEVKVYESLGSDNELRKFGTAYAYDTADSDFSDNRYIANNSPLGNLGLGDGVKTEFQIECFPIVGSTLQVYESGVPIAPSAYTVDAITGKITFTTAPASGDRLTCEYQLAKNAHEPSNDFTVFTFNRFTIEEQITPADPEGQLGNGNGTQTVFTLTHTNIDETRFKLYLNGAIVPSADYTLDATNGSVTFNTAPTSTDVVTVDYVYFIQPDANGVIPDYVVSTFDNQDELSIMEQVYTTVNFHQASPPMQLSFNPDQRYTNEWQRDSIIYFYGNVNKDRIIMFLRIDPTGNPVNAYFVPLYIGKLRTLGQKPRKNNVLIGGCRTGDAFVWAKDKMIGNSVVDYGVETANGNTVASLQQSYSGAMYQNHYFAFITHDKEVDNGQGRYNPSMYSNKYHLSQIFLVHPNDGYVGKLDDIYAVHPKNIQQADELEIVKTVTDEEVGVGDGVETIFHIEHKPKDGTLAIQVNCVDIPATDPTTSAVNWTFNPDTKTVTFTEAPTGEILADYEFAQLFRYTLPTTPISPCTQDKATPFNPIGLAIYKEDLV